MSTYHVTCNVLTDMEDMKARLLREKIEELFFFFNKKITAKDYIIGYLYLLLANFALITDRIPIMIE